MDTRPRALLISFCTVQLRTFDAVCSLATLCLSTTSAPDLGELPSFWAFIPRKGLGNNNRRVPNWPKGRLHTMVRPSMLYGMETVPLTKEQKRKIKEMEMRMLRFAQEITRKDKIRNEVIRKRMKVGSMQDKLR